ncbi:hypothetical protein KEM52_005097 [Ascosphaera acerosa]|nr:hypothetical protein KEM52_005097 [Ascosphaera acerosa]
MSGLGKPRPQAAQRTHGPIARPSDAQGRSGQQTERRKGGDGFSLQSQNPPSSWLPLLAQDVTTYGGEVTTHRAPTPLPHIERFTHIISSTIDFPEYTTVSETLIPVIKPEWIDACILKLRLVNPRQYNPDPRRFLSGVNVTCADIPDGDKQAIIGAVLAMGGLHTARLMATTTHVVGLSAQAPKCAAALKMNEVEGQHRMSVVLPHWFDDCLKLGKRIDERPYLLPDPEILRSRQDEPISRVKRSKDLAGASSPTPTSIPPALSAADTDDKHINDEHQQEVANSTASSSSTDSDAASRPALHIFKDRTLMLSSDLDISPRLRTSIESLITHSDGRLTTDPTAADIFVCRYRRGAAYTAAILANKEVGNLAWLFHLITRDAWTAPSRRLLHFPLAPADAPIPGFAGLTISLSNYVGEARTYLENLINAAGAECTKHLRQSNTHLITAHGTSEKCTAAREWGIQIVNHLWLEESYAKWRRMPESNPRYTHLPRRTNLSEVVGQTEIDREVVRRMAKEEQAEGTDNQEHEATRDELREQDGAAEVAARSPTAATTPGAPHESGQRAIESRNPVSVAAETRTCNGSASRPAISTPMSGPNISIGGRRQTQQPLRDQENDNPTPSTTHSRKSKEKATALLHRIGEDMALYEKEKKRAGGVVYGGLRRADSAAVASTPTPRSRPKSGSRADRTPEAATGTATPPVAVHDTDQRAERRHRKRPLSPHGEEAGSDQHAQEQTKRAKSSSEAPRPDMRLLITGFKRWVEDPKLEVPDRRILREIGVHVVSEPKRCTHLAAPSILRTPKFLSAVAYAPQILSDRFVEDCIAQKTLPAPEDYLLRDAASEKRYKISLQDVRARAQANQNNLFQGMTFYCIENIQGGYDVFRSIAETNGGQCLLYRGRSGSVRRREKAGGESGKGSGDKPDEDDAILLSGDAAPQKKVWEKFRDHAKQVGRRPRIVRVDWLIECVLAQEVRSVKPWELT